MINVENLRRILLQLLERADSDHYSGYSKFDALLSPLARATALDFWLLRLLWTQAVMRAPFNIRPLVRVPKGVNPKGVALFARANLTAHELALDPRAFRRAQDCLDWLLEHDVRARWNFSGSCWGYHHPWQSPGFYNPAYYPNCVVTVFAAEALMDGYRVFGDARYRDAARSAADFLLNDLTVLCEDDAQKAIAYVPRLQKPFVVINNNALAGAFLAKVARVTGESRLWNESRKLMEFVARNRTDYYAWYYTVDPCQTLITHDNYHTGGIVDAFLEYEQATDDARYRDLYTHALAYYRQHLFLDNGAPKWMNNQTYPLDVHGAAQGIISFALAGDLEFAARIAQWTIDNLYLGDGTFAYQKTRWLTKRFALVHWCNGWMARALSVLLEKARLPRIDTIPAVPNLKSEIRNPQCPSVLNSLCLPISLLLNAPTSASWARRYSACVCAPARFCPC